jgi:hypothetical protein
VSSRAEQSAFCDGAASLRIGFMVDQYFSAESSE